MDDEKKAVLQRHHQELRSGLIVGNILPALRPLLTAVEYLQVRDGEGDVEKVDKLIEILLTKDNRHFDGFCTALGENGCEHWAKTLREGAGAHGGASLEEPHSGQWQVQYPVIDDLADDFSLLVAKISTAIRSLSPDHLKELKACVEEKLKSKNAKVRLPNSVEDLICAISNYWDFLNFEFAQLVVRYLAVEDLRKQMQQYEEDVQKKSEKLLAECSKKGIAPQKPPICSSMMITMRGDSFSYSLHRILEMKEFLVRRVGVSFAQFAGWSHGCIVLHFYIPVDDIEAATLQLKKQELQLQGMPMVAIVMNGTVVYEDKLNFHQAKHHLTTCVKAVLNHLTALQAFLGQIQDCPTAVSTANHIHESLTRMVEATEQEQMKVAFLGNISNGKSTILNALFKEKVLLTGKGSTTTCICTITGVPPGQLPSDHANGYFKMKDSQKMKLTELGSLMKQGSLKVGDVLEIYLPTPSSNVWLNKDVVLIDSPGLGADDATAEAIQTTCGGADVFVYVCDGTRTLEETVKKWLGEVNHQLPNLSKNLFILFNHWDRVVDDDEEEEEEEEEVGDSERLRRRHLQDMGKFLVQDLQASAILDRTFFVSGKEACKILENEKSGKQPTAGCKVLKRNWHERWTEFRKFESMLHAFLSGSAIQIKCGRHWEACMEFKSQLHGMMEQFKLWCSEEMKALDRDVNLTTSHLERIDAAEHAVQQTSQEKVLSAMEEFRGMIDKFHDRIKNVLQLKVEGFRAKLEDEKWADYQKAMIEHLDKELKELLESVEEQMGTFAIDKINHIQDTYAELSNGTNEPQTQVGQDKPRLNLKHPSISDMTKGYRARPWFGRALMGRDHIEPVALLTALITPLNVLTISLMGLVWVNDRDEHLKQFKEKIIDRLMKQHLHAKKMAKDSHGMDNFRNLLNYQVEIMNHALANRKKHLSDQINDLQRRITDHQSWITQATSFQDQLQQEVEPQLSRFYQVYLQGESA